MKAYEVDEIERRIEAALARIRTLLDNTRNPKAPADVPHRYDDKYQLAESVARVSIASIFHGLEVVGLTAERLHELQEWAKTRSVTLRFSAREECRFLREATRKEEPKQEFVSETRGFLGKLTSTQKVVTNVTEWFWAFDASYEIVAFKGTEVEKPVVLFERTGSVEIKTLSKEAPRPASRVEPHVDVSLTWLLQQLDAEGRACLTIDRADKDCHTPRRNAPIEAALRETAAFHDFCERVVAYLMLEVFPVQEGHNLDLDGINALGVFVPVLPIFEAGEKNPGEALLPASHLDAFLAEERRSLAEKCRALSSTFPRDYTLITAAAAGLLVTLLHAKEVCRHLAGGVAYIEVMLERQLVAAVGKELTVADFNAFMQFHHAKLVKPAYRPRPFSYAIRRPDHSPEGVLSLEAETGSSALLDPISTTVAHREHGAPMSFALDASTRVSFTGERFLHGWIAHQFSGEKGLALQLVARARQFSSFILLVGRVASAESFEPKFGVIVQNKDLLKVPILLEQLPTPKEFRDAIESLSPEQQRFAKAFRGMQLESTLFGVCVIQIKPQLEKLLKLPPDSLTKEIKLTQDLLRLFIEFQIPSDLLSYDGAVDASTDAKLALVKDYVGRMQQMIDLSKQRQIDEEREREALRLAEQNRTRYPVEALEDETPRGYGPATYGGGGPPPPPVPMAAPPSGAPRSHAIAVKSRAPGAAGSFAGPPSFAASAPPPPAAPPPPPPLPNAPQQAAPPRVRLDGEPDGERPDGVDYTRLPGELDRKLEAIDEDAALRATILTPSIPWSVTAQKGLLSPPVSAVVGSTELKGEKNKAFDLLDALTRSGALPLEDASLHVVIAATHCFDKTLLETVIQDNANPIEKVERSLMILGTTIHGQPASELLVDDHRDRFLSGSPLLGPAQG